MLLLQHLFLWWSKIIGNIFEKHKVRSKILTGNISTGMTTMHKHYHSGPDTYQSRDFSDDISVITVLGCAILNILWVIQDRDQLCL
jgi:hypothetical protein